MIFISMVFWFLCFDGLIGRIDGFILLGLLIIFLIWGIATAKENNSTGVKPSRDSYRIFRNMLFIISGVFMLAYGAKFVVQEAISIAVKFGLSQTFIGISVVALGTSLPELATSAVAAAKGESDLSVGNVVGSNLFNICLVMGTVGILNPMGVDKNLHTFQFPFMIFICILLGVIAFTRHKITQLSGSLFILLFIVYIIVSYIK